jgi:hypothetical protein
VRQECFDLIGESWRVILVQAVQNLAYLPAAEELLVSAEKEFGEALAERDPAARERVVEEGFVEERQLFPVSDQDVL